MENIDTNYKRSCPQCSNEIFYLSKNSLLRAQKRNSPCRSCSAKLQYLKDPLKNLGRANGRYGKLLVDVFKNKYGDVWEEKHAQWRQNLNRFKSGKNNTSYGKIFGSGRGIKGDFKSVNFRSSLELMFLLLFELRNGFLPISAESDIFRFFDDVRTVVPDFYCAKCNTVYEIKMSYFLNKDEVLEKVRLSKDFLESKGFVYKLITSDDLKIGRYDWRKVKKFIRELYEQQVINLNVKDISRIEKVKGTFTKFESDELNFIREGYIL